MTSSPGLGTGALFLPVRQPPELSCDFDRLFQDLKRQASHGFIKLQRNNPMVAFVSSFVTLRKRNTGMVKVPPWDTPPWRLARELLPSLLGKGDRGPRQLHDDEGYYHDVIHVTGFAPTCGQRWSRRARERLLSGSDASPVITRITIFGAHC